MSKSNKTPLFLSFLKAGSEGSKDTCPDLHEFTLLASRWIFCWPQK